MEEKPLLRARVEKCPECGSKNIIKDYDTGEDVCSNCGFVLRQKIYDLSPEWRAFDEEQREKRPRTGLPLTYTIHDMGLTTEIDPKNMDKYGKPFSSEQKETFYRLRKWQKRMKISEKVEHSLAYGLNEAKRICDQSNLPEFIYEDACLILRKVIKEGLLRGRKLDSIVPACIYLACRRGKVPRTLEEIANTSLSTKKEIARNYRDIIKEMDCWPQPQSPFDYISKLVNKLQICGETEGIIQKILYNARELKITSGKSPLGLAAAAAYISSTLTGERRTQKEITEVANCTEVTLRNRYKQLMENFLFIVEI